MKSPSSASPPRAREFLRFPPSDCFGCSAENPAGLQLRFHREGDLVVCEHVVAAAYDGAPGVVHGGVQAVLLDETMCAAVTFLHGTRVVTGELHVRYRRPCPSGRPLRVEAHITSRHERYATVAAEVRDEAGELLTSAEGKFFYNAG